jgi:hypothetical protein
MKKDLKMATDRDMWNDFYFRETGKSAPQGELDIADSENLKFFHWYYAQRSNPAYLRKKLLEYWRKEQG